MVESLCWRDVRHLCSGEDEEAQFKSNIVKFVGIRESTKFWEHYWIGERPLKEVFPILYSISLQKGKWICEVGEIKGDSWYWNLRWRKELFV